MKNKKTIFMTVGEASVAQHLLRGSFWTKIKSEQGLNVVLIVPPLKKEEYGKEFAGENVTIESLDPITPKGLERLLIFFALSALRTRTVTLNQVRKYLTEKGLVRHALFILKRSIWLICGRSRIFQTFLRKLGMLCCGDKHIKNLFDKHKPDLVFAAVAMFTEMDVPILREAKKRKLATVGLTRGWDSFTNTGVMRMVPDILMVYNRYAEETAIKYQFIKPEKIVRVGFPRNDWFMKKDLLESREHFLKRIGVDPVKRVIFFGAMEHFWFPRDEEVAKVFGELIGSDKLPKDLVLFFRPYPGSTGTVDRLRGLPYIVSDDRSFTVSSADTWELREKETAHLINSIVHSEMVITVASTLAIDGVALGKPAISVGFEKKPVPYWFSAARFLDHWVHWVDLLNTGGLRRADNPQELADVINGYLENPSLDKEGRACLRERFLEPYDSTSGERVAKVIISQLAL